MLRATLLALSHQRRLRQWAEHSRWGRRLSGRFVAGTTLDEALAAARALNQQGLEVSLDRLGENVQERGAAQQATAEAITVLEAIARAGVRANLSLKLTQLGLDLDRSAAAANLRTVLEVAARLNSFVRVDMEGSAYTEATLALVEQARGEGWPVGTVLQAALHRTPADLERLIAAGVPIRLVKGAYREPRAVAWQRKAAVDGQYRRLMRRLLEVAAVAAHDARRPPAIATHDVRMIRAATRYARRHGLPREAFEFQMLYGIGREWQRRLVAEGWRVRIYVPFGPAWYPYLMRRLAERPANLLFLLRNLGN